MNEHPVSARFKALAAVLVVLFILSLAWFIYGSVSTGVKPSDTAVSGVLLSIPLALMYFSIGVLVTAWWQRRSRGSVEGRLARFIYFTPRIAGILIVLFVSLFALDVFSMGLSLWDAVLGFIIHALPAIVMAALLALAWRWPVVGFAVFLAAAVFFLGYGINDLRMEIGNILIFSGPMVVIAMLFWANWKWEKPGTVPARVSGAAGDGSKTT